MIHMDTLRKIALISVLLCASCNSPAKVQVGEVTVESSARAGGKGGIYVRHGDTEIAVLDNNEDSFREAAKTARFGIGATQLASVAKSGIAAVTSVKNTTTAADVSKAAGSEATAQTAIAADVTKTGMATESAAGLVLPPVPPP